eukprot:6795576-Prymnesium_polylepis.2
MFVCRVIVPVNLTHKLKRLTLTLPLVWPMPYGLWFAIRRYSSATRLYGASGTRYVSSEKD